jgi:pyridoxamine 5'-phosphate oxidase
MNALMDFDHPPADPVALLTRWIEEARVAGLPNPNAMALATVDAGGAPSDRIVLLKGLDSGGAVFFTNQLSRKGQALAAQPRVSLLFHWDILNRQVRIEGAAKAVGDAESDAYFATRPREARIGAWASRQSQPVRNRAELDAAVAETEKRFAGLDVPRPPHWGGYRVSLDRIEFWQGHPYRLHDRVVYSPDAGGGRGGWRTQRLFP